MRVFLIIAFFYLCWRLLLLTWYILSSLWSCLTRRKSDFVAKYSKDGQKYKSWVLVTGGSDGIGLELCKQHANMGFNIIMVARNEKKMNEKLQEVKQCAVPAYQSEF